MIKHQYSISSVNSTKSSKRQSISGRKHAKRHSVVKSAANRASTNGKHPMCDGGKRHHCHYCSKQVHVNIEDLTRDSDGMDEVDRCRFTKHDHSCDISASCSSGEDEMATHFNGTNINMLERFEETRLANEIHVNKKREVVESCPVCKIFNKFVTVNNTCDFIAETHCTDHEQDEFCKLFKKSANIADIDGEVKAQSTYHDGGLDKPNQFERLNTSKARSIRGRTILMDKVMSAFDEHIDIEIPEVNNPRAISNARELKIGIARSKRQVINTGNADKVKSRLANRRDDKKMLRRRSTYDLFVDKRCEESMTDNFDESKNDYTNRLLREKQHFKQYKPLKTVSLENDSCTISYEGKLKEMVGEKSIRLTNRSRSIDEECYTREHQCSSYDNEENKLIGYKTCKERSKQDIFVYKRDFDNYVYFQSTNKEIVEKLKQQKRVRNSVSLNDSFQSQNGPFERAQHCFEEQESSQNRREAFSNKIENYARNEHKHTFEGKVTYADTTQSNQIGDHSIKFGETGLIPDDKIFEETYPNQNPPNIGYRRYYFFQKNVQTYQRFSTTSKVDSNEHSKGSDQSRYLQNQIEESTTREAQQNHSGNNCNISNRSIRNAIAQPHLKCSKQNKRLMRRKSFDLNIYNSRETLLLEKCQPKQRTMLRRKSCDFGQITKENQRPRYVTNDDRNASKKLATRSWSNESIVDKDLCSIFENPMTAYHFFREDIQKPLQKLAEESNIENKAGVNLLILGRGNRDYRLRSEETQRSIDKDFRLKQSWSNISQCQLPHTSTIATKISEDSGGSRENYQSVLSLSKGTKRKLFHSRSFHFGIREDIGVHERYKRRLDEE